MHPASMQLSQVLTCCSVYQSTVILNVLLFDFLYNFIMKAFFNGYDLEGFDIISKGLKGYDFISLTLSSQGYETSSR